MISAHMDEYLLRVETVDGRQKNLVKFRHDQRTYAVTMIRCNC